MTKSKFNESTVLINIVWPTFIEVEDCILIQDDQESPRTVNIEFVLEQFGDRSGFEAAESHVHMMDVSRYFMKHPKEGFSFAQKIMNMWAVKLKFDFPNYNFLIILSFDGEDSIVRFHRIREEENLWIDIDRIEDFKNEGICIVKV
ncbi:hypothetical protein [Paenibacillus sp. YIM B09110]|uniref:hypothetical protein n=1 Tax=Paenibacillus sp. YIM B09110 TaxID=3126102 RepID=UPI00301C9CA7